MPGRQREWEIGRHQLHFEPPDILWVEYRGSVSLQEARHMVDVSRELGASRPFFMVGDMKEATLPEPEAGRHFSDQLRFEWLLGTIYIGTRLVQRATAKGILLAAYLMERMDARALELDHFVSTREEARALMARLRADRTAQASVREPHVPPPAASPVLEPLHEE